MKYVRRYLIYYTIKLIGIISTVSDRKCLPIFIISSLCLVEDPTYHRAHTERVRFTRRHLSWAILSFTL